MATSLEKLKKRFRSRQFHQKLHREKIAKIVKIGLVDPEIIGLNLKRKKSRKLKYMAQSASLLSGLK